MTEPKTFIRYQNRNSKHQEIVYATLCMPEKVNNKKSQ
jgi:hypothetical protein